MVRGWPKSCQNALQCRCVDGRPDGWQGLSSAGREQPQAGIYPSKTSKFQVSTTRSRPRAAHSQDPGSSHPATSMTSIAWQSPPTAILMTHLHLLDRKGHSVQQGRRQVPLLGALVVGHALQRGGGLQGAAAAAVG
jgi:hypothetical protein